MVGAFLLPRKGWDAIPLQDFHACRIRRPGDFQEDSFRTTHEESDGKPISLILGRLKNETTLTLQAFRYPKDDWEVAQARSHCEDHDGILFEPASGEDSLSNEDMVALSELSQRCREADVQALQDYSSGKGDAPTIYKAYGYMRAIEGGDMVFVASEETPDRMGDTIDVEGWDTKNFKSNPVFMWSHDYNIAPIGKVPKIWVEGKQLLNTVKWDESDPLGSFIKGKFERGFMRAESVGFRPLEVEQTPQGFHFMKQELLEISAVSIPAHPKALAKMLEGKKFTIVMPEVVKEEPPLTMADLVPWEPPYVTSLVKPEEVVTLEETDMDKEEKAGAVLSRANIAKLKQAQTLIGEVVTSGDKPTEEPEDDKGKLFTDEEMDAILEAVRFPAEIKETKQEVS